MIFHEWNANQRRIYIDAVQIYDAYSAALRENRSYRGGMHWKKSKGREYLFKTADRFGNGKSLGLRSPHTEKILTQFKKGKEANRERLTCLKTRLAEQSRFCKAAMIQRVPRIVTSILKILDEKRVLGGNVMVVGTHAICAYETAAGVFMDSSLLATGDMDILWNIHSRLNLAAKDESGLLGMLQRADRSFEQMRLGGFRAVNKNGFMVDLIKPEPRRITQKDRRRMGGAGDLEAAEIRNLQWLTSSPRLFRIVIGDDGYPAPMAVPDPRSFAIHKWWLSRQTDREPVKKARDVEQGKAVAALTRRYLPQYPFNPSDLRMFPKELVDGFLKSHIPCFP